MLTLLFSLRDCFRARAVLQAEILALRHQLLVLQRSSHGHRGRLGLADRVLWVWLSQLWDDWRSALLIVKPETVIAWHRQGFRLYWRWKSRRNDGRPSVSPEVRNLIRQMSLANPRWGAPRIHGELLKIGIEVSQATVAKYMARHRKPPSQTWRTFLRNHAKDLVSVDFFVVTTIAFQLLFVFVILDQRPTVFATRPGRRLRREILRDGEMEGHSRSPDCTSEPLAERLCRAVDRVDSSRVPGSRCRLP
jgi:putative transposase